jgi:hypothetical protein
MNAAKCSSISNHPVSQRPEMAVKQRLATEAKAHVSSATAPTSGSLPQSKLTN